MYFKTKDLAVGYSGKPLIEDINIGIEKGKILCLLGPNGSGKSTILKSITKHLKEVSGAVFIGKEDIKHFNNTDMAKKVAVVLTERVAPEMMTCEEVVATGRYPYTNHFGKLSEEDKKIIHESMKLVSANDLKDKDFFTLSDGQKQRVMLARAICQQPDVIVLDEPTSYLDIKHKIELLGILRKMAIEQEITVILSLHEVDLATKLADEIVLVKDNKICSSGFPEDILDDEIIKRLYGINQGSFNLKLGSVELPYMSNSDCTAFVLGGDGYGTKLYRSLHKKGISFYTGILHHNDIDYYVGLELAKDIVYEKSFNYISTQTFQNAKNLLLKSDLVIDCGVEYGELNSENLELLNLANDKNIPILSLRSNKLSTIKNINYFDNIQEMLDSQMTKFIWGMRL